MYLTNFPLQLCQTAQDFLRSDFFELNRRVLLARDQGTEVLDPCGRSARQNDLPQEPEARSGRSSIAMPHPPRCVSLGVLVRQRRMVVCVVGGLLLACLLYC